MQNLQLIEYAGRTCYMSRDKITEDSFIKFIQSLINRGHESPLEHASATLELITSRDVLAEITRHRLASFSVMSQRYVLQDGDHADINFIKPVNFDNWTKDAKGCWQDHMQSCEMAYKRMLLHEMTPEEARKVLPESTATDIIMTANLREWLHVLELRDSPRAYPEMRVLAGMIRTELQKVYPYIFDLPDIG